MYSTGSKALIRQLNRAAVLNLIKREGPISRVEIARRLALSGASVTSIAGELEALGLIRDVAQVASTGGRPRTLVALNPQAACVIGLKLAIGQVAAVLVDLEGNVVHDRVVPLEGHSLDEVRQSVGELVADFRGRTAGGHLLGVGIGMPGVVDGSQGLCVDSPMLGWRDLPLGELLAGDIGVPVMVDNDVNTLAVAEQLYGHGRNVGSFIAVTIGRGVGSGMVIDDQLVRGRLGGAGEFGHVPVAPDGPTCACGRRGCLETFVADERLVEAGQQAGLLRVDEQIADLTALADAGNERAREIFASAADRLGTALAGVVNLLSPELIIVSGEGMRARQHIEPALRNALEGHVFPPLAGIPLVIDQWQDTKWARGAAALVLEHFFSAGREENSNGRAPDLASFVAEAV